MAALTGLHQRTNADIHAENVLRCGGRLQISRRGLQNEFDLFFERGAGYTRVPRMGVSVVPTTVWPCQGMANSTRPSLVWGTMMAVSPEKRAVEDEVDALAGRDHAACTAGSASRRSSSVKMPVALITTCAPDDSLFAGFAVDAITPLT